MSNEARQISRQDFIECAKRFKKASSEIDQKWNFSEPNEILMHKEKLWLTSNESDDPSLFVVEYHVIYSPSYRVPVLYFNLYDQTGCQADKEVTRRAVIRSELAEFTLQMHPVFNIPFWMLNPCQTVASLDVLNQQQPKNDLNCLRNYLTTWMSMVGQVVNIEVDPHYSQCK